MSGALLRALEGVRADARSCRRCPLYRNATQTVFGEGPAPCSVMLVGEQPGDYEDREGRPFVGPAGRLLDKALAVAGLDRDAVYLTNAVKHFKNEPRGKRRLHRRPTAGEIDVCKWWLDKELDIVKPRVVVALGASAARALTGRSLRIGTVRGQRIALAPGRSLVVTVHPALLLRLPDRAARKEGFDAFVADLAAVAAWASSRTRRARSVGVSV